MWKALSQIQGCLLFLVASTILAGCAEAPFGLVHLNPVLREEWKKDEAYGPTIHTKTADLQRLAAAAASLPPADQNRLSTELVDLLREEKNPLLARQMVRTLAAFPTPQSVEGLRLASDHSDAEVRKAACEAWQRKGGQDALEQLCKIVVSDTDLDVRITAARELKSFRDPLAVESLGTALNDPNPALQYRCVQSLSEITGRQLGDNVQAWKQYVASGEAHPVQTVSWTERLGRGF